MQQSPLTLRQKLIEAVDERYHVKDMAAIVEVLGTLERLSVTKEMLETTRLGKTVNEFRKRINNEKLAKRAKALVKKWRDAVLDLTETQQSGRSLNGNVGASSISDGPGPVRGNLSTALSSLQGYNSSTSSPKLQTSSSKVSPAGSHNSNSLSPRVLTTFNSNSTSNNRNGSNNNNSDSIHRNILGAAHHHGSISSPLNSTSLTISSPSSAPYLLNKSKSSPYGTTTSIYSQSSTKSPLLSSSYSYAPNSEIVAKTNAANKRLRKDEDSGICLNSGPPSKKPRTLINGTGVGGTLDDPLTLDEHSKDSIISRTSDHSDGSSSKPLSNVSSNAVLSAAPSPMTAYQDSDLSPPLSVETAGANNNNKALITDEKISSYSPLTADENSAAENAGAVEQLEISETPTAPIKRGRKRKKKEVVDAGSLLREQIAKAQAEGKMKTIERFRETLDEERSGSPTIAPPPPPLLNTPVQATLRQPQLTALSSEDPVAKNEIVEKYLESQNELRTQMERQYQDALARNEFKEDEEDEMVDKQLVEIDETKKKKKKDKRKKESSDKSGGHQFPNESEILSRLPPIDPDILAEFQNFTFYENPVVEEIKVPNSEDKETDNLINNSTSLSLSNQQPSSTTTEGTTTDPIKKLIATKIDWGDSDEDEDFEEVPIPDSTSMEDQVDNFIVQLCPLVIPATIIEPESNNMSIEEEPNDAIPLDEIIDDTKEEDVPQNVPLREVDESEVERLHSEKINNLNGNTNKNGQFCEWQETLAMESLNGDILHILPYTIIDF